MKWTINISWKVILSAVGAALFGWFMRHMLDKWKAFEFIEEQYDKNKGWLTDFLYSTITVLDIIVFLPLAILSYFIFYWILKKLFGKQERLKRNVMELQKFNSKDINTLHFKWEVRFQGNRPVITNLTPYCNNKHPFAIPMAYDIAIEKYICPSCANMLSKPSLTGMGTYGDDFGKIRGILQGELENQWQELNKS